MADKKKRRKRSKSTSGRPSPASPESRYVPRTVKQPSKFGRIAKKLTPVFMFGFFGLGVVVIILNYLPTRPLLSALPGQETYYLLGGLGLICLGFVAATRYD